VVFQKIISEHRLREPKENMIRKGISGGVIGLNNLICLNKKEANAIKARILTASSLRESARIGLQRLYADPEDALKKYKGTEFDIANEMLERRGMKLLWVRCRAIDANVVNANGDYFSTKELLKETIHNGKKVPAYKTFEGVPIYTNHENDDIEKAKGTVVYAEWDEKEEAVYCVFYIDEEAYPEIAHAIRGGIMHDVSMGCFIPGTRVLTNSGYKNIENVNINDLLLDKDGNFTTIVNRQIKIKNEDIFDIKFNGGLTISATKEHPHFVFKKDVWKSRKTRNKPGKGKERWSYKDIGEPIEITSENLEVGDVLVTPINQVELNPDNITPDFARLLGYFLAEGNFLKYNDSIKELELTFGLHEKYTLVQEFITLFSKEFPNSTIRVYDRIPNNNCVIRVYDTEIANLFYKYCGEYSDSKKLDSSLMFLPKNIQLELIKGYFNGDGCIHRAKDRVIGLSASSCSLDLVEQISMILFRNGIYHKKNGRINGKYIEYTKSKEAWKQKGDFRKTYYEISIPQAYCPQLLNETRFDFQPNLRQDNFHYGNWIIHPIKNIIKRHYEGLVYNFETESHTYMVENFATHNCAVQSGNCSICGKEAVKEDDYCSHMKNYKGKKFPGTGEIAYEKNKDIKFIEISIVADGAFDSCMIKEIYEQEEIENAASQLRHKTASVQANILLAENNLPEDMLERRKSEEFLRAINNCNIEIFRFAEKLGHTTRIAQEAGTLVGGQMGGGQIGQNATVNTLMQLLGIDPTTGLNILDMLNLALNFLEVAVMELLSKSSSVKLEYVNKVTKAMTDLQDVMEDVINDGVDVAQQPQGVQLQGGPVSQQQPVPGQQPQGQQQQTQVPGQGQPGQVQQQANVMPMAYQPAVGQVTGPMFGALPGVTATSSNRKLVWASHDDDDVREVFASSNRGTSVKKVKSFDEALTHIGEVVIKLASAVGVADDSSLKALNFKIKKNQEQSKSTQPGGNNMENNIFNEMAQRHRLRNASKLSIDAVFTDHSNRYSVAISTDGTVKASVDNKRVAWDCRLNDTQIERLQNNDIAPVGNEILDTFVGFVKTAETEGRKILAYEKPKTVTNIFEVSLEGERTGTDDDVRENTIKPLRTGVEDETQEVKLEKYRTGVKEDVRENLLADEAGLYARRNEERDIAEVLLEDARVGVNEEVLENKLNHHRAQESSVETHEAVAKVLSGFGNAVLASKNTPDEVVTAAIELAKKDNFNELLVVAAAGTQTRTKVASRYAFHNKPLPTLSASAAVLNELGKVIVSGVSAVDVAQIVREASANKDHAVKAAYIDAKGKMGEDFSFDAYYSQREASKTDAIRVALASLSGDANDNISGVEQVKTALAAMAKTTVAIKVTPKEILTVLASVDAKQLSKDLTVARDAKEVKARNDLRERVAFFEGANIRIASEVDIYNTIVGYLADYANKDKFNTSSIVEAIGRVVDKPRYAEKYVSRLAFSSIREAEATITEDTNITRRLQCTLGELGLDAKDENFDDMLKQKVAELFVQRGYPIDPNNFNLTDVMITAEGACTATISTRSTKTFKVDPSESGEDENVISVDGAPTPFEPEAQPTEGEGVPLVPTDMSLPPTDPNEQPTIMTAGAIALRKAKRENLLRLAQMPGGGGGGMPGAGGGMPGGAGAAGAAGAPDLSGAGDGPGVGALTNPPDGGLDDMGGSDQATENKDSMPTPGKQLPWGSICPACGSASVSLVDGKGSCADCKAEITYEFKATVIPGSKKNEEAPTDEMSMDIPGLGTLPGAEAGANGATPPAGGAPGMGGAAPAGGQALLQAQASWLADSRTFVRTAQADFNKATEQVLPPGFICPGCANREVNKLGSQTFCYACKTISKSQIIASRIPGKVIARVTWVLK